MSAKSRPFPERKDSHTMTAPADTPVNDSVRSSNISPTQSSNSYSTSESNRASDEPSTDTAAFDALKRRFAEVSHLDILVHCMGGPRVSDIPDIAKDLAEHIIVICVDCEHWSDNTDETTEIGIATFSRQVLRPLVLQGDFGDHGEHLLQQVKFYLFRLIETAHLPCMNAASRGVNGNRFGKGRFVTNDEAHKIMEGLFVQPIKDVPGVQGNHPIIVLGQDVGHDKENLKNKSISFDMESYGTLVREIDTQVIVRDRKYWTAPNNEQIGLVNLVKELWFEHSDPHTAANDAGRTLISAFQMALGGHVCKLETKKTMLQVATGIEKYSVENFTSIGGVEEYCWKCGSPDHMIAACTATGLECNECRTMELGEEHVTLHCLPKARQKATERRRQDAIKRAKKAQEKTARDKRTVTSRDSHGSSSTSSISAVSARARPGRGGHPSSGGRGGRGRGGGSRSPSPRRENGQAPLGSR
ncbi:hypothetical protein PTNB73_09065 [Pyrenophora teres f. teres]|nr:hypothetical protein HRS9139_09289 [Pyrenophora teres f. teres]KAE8831394.1 hypothetical protein HRS9122_08984 [Pyrenophora teres f. teres]KAE8855164.1 hypothetical protein PTNB29_09415 [Pyrenophora teres f. teres]KAE8857817.1 hypothetical protein PTNB73_09065 [Pyrenophora teres f. teres]CAA9966014.1 hypothetical protein PTMSG1_09373 [Pyrenophora teres f. maculata]